MIKFLKKAFGSKKKEKKKKPDAKAKQAKAKLKNNNESDQILAADVSTTENPIENSSNQKDDTSTQLQKPDNSSKTEREKLIEDALAIHKAKSKILDNLPPAVRTKLTAMAMAIYIKQKSDNKKH